MATPLLNKRLVFMETEETVKRLDEISRVTNIPLSRLLRYAVALLKEEYAEVVEEENK
jgi:hypothetical protein